MGAIKHVSLSKQSKDKKIQNTKVKYILQTSSY